MSIRDTSAQDIPVGQASAMRQRRPLLVAIGTGAIVLLLSGWIGRPFVRPELSPVDQSRFQVELEMPERVADPRGQFREDLFYRLIRSAARRRCGARAARCALRQARIDRHCSTC